MKNSKWILCLLFVLLGCAGPKKQLKEVEIPEISFPKIEAPKEGCIWTPHSKALFSDPIARNIGDTVTVNIVETSKASNKATTNADRSSTLDAGIEKFLGYEKALAEKNPRFDPKNMINSKFEYQFKGSGNTARESKVIATLTATVVKVLPNNNLVISGSRKIKINNEDQIMVLQGIIRPEDILPNNTILSSYIANCKISYSGRGVISEKQRPGWLTRVLDYVWPF